MSPQYQRSGGACAVFAGIVGLLYSMSFLIVSRVSHDAASLLSSLFVWLGITFWQQRVSS